MMRQKSEKMVRGGMNRKDENDKNGGKKKKKKEEKEKKMRREVRRDILGTTLPCKVCCKGLIRVGTASSSAWTFADCFEINSIAF